MSTTKLENIVVDKFEICFKSPAYENDIISIYQSEEENSINFILVRSYLEVCATAKLIYKK